MMHLDEFEPFGSFALPVAQQAPIQLPAHIAADIEEAEPIVRDVVGSTGVSREEIFGRTRKAPVVEARYRLIGRLRRELHWSLPRIGRLLGRDHTTILYAIPLSERDKALSKTAEIHGIRQQRAVERHARMAAKAAARFAARQERNAKLEKRAAAREAKYAEIERRYRLGETLISIAESFSPPVTRQRISQILSRRGLTRFDGGQSKIAKDKRELLKSARNERTLAFRGVSFDEYAAISAIDRADIKAGRSWARTIRGSFLMQRKNTRARGLPWELTFAQWWGIWQASGKWEERGKGKGKYSLRMRDASLGYTLENSFIYQAVRRRPPNPPRVARPPKPPKAPKIAAVRVRPASTVAITDAVLSLWQKGLPSAEIGNQLGIHDARVRVLVQRARAFGDPRAVARCRWPSSANLQFNESTPPQRAG